MIATYLERPESGEVSRRTMFVRNNGRTEDGEPSFTLLYSRCAHLGCPVRPNGLIFTDEAKEVGPHSAEITPTLATGFGCPCHGGQYDTEGNRTAGPPVRALDQCQFAIVNGQLVLGPSSASPRSRASAPRPGSTGTGGRCPACTSTAPRPGSIRSRSTR